MHPPKSDETVNEELVRHKERFVLRRDVVDEKQSGDDVFVVSCLETRSHDSGGSRNHLPQQARSQLGLEDAP